MPSFQSARTDHVVSLDAFFSRLKTKQPSTKKKQCHFCDLKYAPTQVSTMSATETITAPPATETKPVQAAAETSVEYKEGEVKLSSDLSLMSYI